MVRDDVAGAAKGVMQDAILESYCYRGVYDLELRERVSIDENVN